MYRQVTCKIGRAQQAHRRRCIPCRWLPSSGIATFLWRVKQFLHVTCLYIWGERFYITSYNQKGWVACFGSYLLSRPRVRRRSPRQLPIRTLKPGVLRLSSEWFPFPYTDSVSRLIPLYCSSLYCSWLIAIWSLVLQVAPPQRASQYLVTRNTKHLNTRQKISIIAKCFENIF